MALPDDFRWGVDGGRSAVFLRQRRVADVVTAYGGRDAWLARLQRSPMDHDRYDVELATRELAVRYVEAWVKRWQDRLRVTWR